MSVGLRGTATARPGPQLGPHHRGGQDDWGERLQERVLPRPQQKTEPGQQCRVSVIPSVPRTEHLGPFPRTPGKGGLSRPSSDRHRKSDAQRPGHTYLVTWGEVCGNFSFLFSEREKARVRHVAQPVTSTRVLPGRGRGRPRGGHWPADTAWPEQRKKRTRTERHPRPSRSPGQRARTPLTGTRTGDLTVRHMIRPAPGAPGCDCPRWQSVLCHPHHGHGRRASFSTQHSLLNTPRAAEWGHS